MAKMSKAECSKAGRSLAKNGSSTAGRKLAQCRWGNKKSKASSPKPKAQATRKSRRLAGQRAETIRQPEPKPKPRKARKQKAPKRSAKGKKVENILVPGLNPPRGDMRNFLEQQRRLYGA